MHPKKGQKKIENLNNGVVGGVWADLICRFEFLAVSLQSE